MSRTRRVYHGGGGLGPDAEIVLSRDESHHVLRVLRLGPGDPVSVFDGRGREWEGALVAHERDETRVRIGAEIGGAVDPTLEVVLFQALCRNERMEWTVQKATEVGVAAIRVVRTARVEHADRRGARLARWGRIALEAAKQSGRRHVPAVDEAGDPPPAPPAGTLGLILTVGGEPGVRPIADYLARPRPVAVWLGVGPEGGFDPMEDAAWRQRGWEAASLGPRTLRTETAGVVAATLVLHTWDDLGSGPPGEDVPV